MPATIPTTEPDRITAGESVAWTREITDYPATSGWTLKYALQMGTTLITIVSTASGSSHAVSVPAGTSEAFTAGAYTMRAYVEKGSGAGLERYTVGQFSVTILPSPLAALGETYNAQMLRLIRDAMLQRIPNGLETTNIDGQELQRISMADLERLERVYAMKVQAELNTARVAAGLKSRRTINARFTRVS